MVEVQLWDEENGKVGDTVNHVEEDGFGITPNGDLVLTKQLGPPPTQPGQPGMGMNKVAYAAGHWVKVEASESKIERPH